MIRRRIFTRYSKLLGALIANKSDFYDDADTKENGSERYKKKFLGSDGGEHQ